MKTSMLSLLAAAALFSGVAVANAAEPVALSNSQLDQVSAGRMGGGNYNSGTVVYAIQFGAGSTGEAYGVLPASTTTASNAALGAVYSTGFAGLVITPGCLSCGGGSH